MKNNKEETNQKWCLSEYQYNKGKRIYMLSEQAKHTIDYSDGIKIENYILQSIKNAKDISDDSSELMQKARDWPSYYHFGIGRSNILKCLDISNDANVLEFGSGCGAITRYLGENFKLVDSIEGSSVRAEITRERCRDLENVRVFCSNLKYVKFDSIYDVVTLIGVLEYAPTYFSDQHTAKEACLTLLELAKTALKSDGALVIAIENKIGIKYWSGCPEDHTGKIFDSIHGYPGNRSQITFSEKELKALLTSAGFSNISFYYCFPDYKFASTIISDIENEKECYLHNWVEVPFASYSIPKTHTFHEGLAIKTLSESGLLREFANSFLVIASQNNVHRINQPDWIAKRFSVKRAKDFRCVTTLRLKPNIHVEKKRWLGDNGDRTVENANIKIKHKVADYPWYEGDLMTFDVFKALFESDFKKKILELLELYYQELTKRYYTGTDDEEGYPLLQGASIDFIFKNIIRNKEKLFGIDDEWHVVGYIPADYVMYRSTIAITGLQNHWIRKKIGNVDKFTIELMNCFFPNYGTNRNKKNKLLEQSFSNLVLVRDDLNHMILPQKWRFLRETLICKFVKKIWDTLPENVKFKITKFFD